MRNRKLFRLLFVLFVVTSLVACASPTPAPQAEGETSDEEPIRVGWFGALSGDQAVWGTAERNGTQLMIEKINEAGGVLGRQIEFYNYDDKGDQLEAVNVVKRLIQEDKVVAIIGSNSSGRNIAVAPIAEENKVPVIATYATNPKVTVPEEGVLNEYTFRVCFTDPYQGAVMANFAYTDLKATKAAVLYEISSDYSVGVRDYFKQTWADLGGELVADEAFKTGDVEFRAQLTKIKDAAPDVIIMPFLYKEVALATKQARDLGITATFIGGDGWPSSELITMAGPSVEGSYLTDHTNINLPNVQDWRNEYKERFGKDFEVNAIMAHDAILVLKTAIEKAGSADPTAIKEALESMDAVEGLTGTIKIDGATHNPVGKAAVINQIKDGDFVLFKIVEGMK
ncbi:MAG: ABC transporter substrate-binding protein [Chloroflexi bacterium]|nr:MAG: ABC transporter substrate-binding protein [Chloroflexota bacterium]